MINKNHNKSFASVISFIAFFAGLFIGAFATNIQTEQLQAKLDETVKDLEKERLKKRSIWPSGADNFFKIPSFKSPQEETNTYATAKDVDNKNNATNDPTAGTADKNQPSVSLNFGNLEQTNSTLKENMPSKEVLKDALKLASIQAREKFVNTTQLDSKQQNDLDEVSKKMSTELADYLASKKDLFKKFQDSENPPRMREFIDIMMDVGEIYQNADDDLQGILTEEQLQKANMENLDIMTLLSPDVSLSLIDEFKKE